MGGQENGLSMTYLAPQEDGIKQLFIQLFGGLVDKALLEEVKLLSKYFDFKQKKQSKTKSYDQTQFSNYS